MRLREAVRDVREEVSSLAASGLDWRTFSARAVGELATKIHADAWCVATADPATLLMTGVTGSADLGWNPRFFDLEYAIADYLPQRELARGPVHADRLSRATGGHLDRSVRWRELMEPFGVGDQLRAALLSASGCWGYMALFRDRSSPFFAASDARFVERLGRPLADGLTLSTMLEGDEEAGNPRALLLLADDLCLISASSSAHELLGETLEPGTTPPAAVLAVAASARAASAESGMSAWSRTRAPSGWLTLSATVLSRAGDDEIAVIVERARPSELVDLKLGAYGLTAREQEVVRSVLAGDSTVEIARHLYISPLTVQQHLKAIFDKTGVSSRRELISQIFEGRYRPTIA